MAALRRAAVRRGEVGGQRSEGRGRAGSRRGKAEAVNMTYFLRQSAPFRERLERVSGWTVSGGTDDPGENGRQMRLSSRTAGRRTPLPPSPPQIVLTFRRKYVPMFNIMYS